MSDKKEPHLTVAKKVVFLNNTTRLNLPAQRVIDGLPEMEDVVIMGYESTGEIYFASSVADGGSVLWLMEKCKKMLLAVGEGE
jgi:hypothetical protein